MKENYIQQGDVLLIESKLPSSLEPKKFDGIIQHGEATGHAHRIEVLEDEVEPIYFEDTTTGKRYLRLTRPKTITHEEHKPIEVPVGDYEIRIVREYDHFDEEARAVID